MEKNAPRLEEGHLQVADEDSRGRATPENLDKADKTSS